VRENRFSISEDFENNDITMLQAQVKLNIRVIKSNSPLSINKFSISHSLNMSQNPSLTVTYLQIGSKHHSLTI